MEFPQKVSAGFLGNLSWEDFKKDFGKGSRGISKYKLFGVDGQFHWNGDPEERGTLVPEPRVRSDESRSREVGQFHWNGSRLRQDSSGFHFSPP